jgi:16S rRNA (guanine966-N2)-methyltransferase
LRVVAGRAKGHQLRAPRGSATRPTSDKVRGALFDVLAGSFIDEPILDLFAGTGALGIEALSRGASEAVFVEKRPLACQVIRENLSHTKFLTNSQVLCMPVERGLTLLDQVFPLILIDPPYAYPDLDRIMTLVSGARVVGSETTVVFEHSPRFVVQKRYDRLVLDRHKVYGDTAVSMFVVQEGENT